MKIVKSFVFAFDTNSFPFVSNWKELLLHGFI